MQAQAMKRCSPAVIIDGNGNFNANLERDLNLAGENCQLAVVSIKGPQSSGKSTLWNACFSTRFQVMDASQGVNQTTKGVWGSKWTPPENGWKFLVTDTEGSDGFERKDNITFERKVSLFALAISNTVVINMECKCIHRRESGSWSLLQTVFEVMVRKLEKPPKRNLVFVLRDKTKTDLKILEKQLIERIREMWDEMAKPQTSAALDDYFNIKVMGLSNFETHRKQFNEEVPILREQIISSSTSSQRQIAASAFIDYARKIWDEIKEDKILNLQLNRSIIDKTYCYGIADEKHKSFCENKVWNQIQKDVKFRVEVEDFGNKVSSLLHASLSEYDDETPYFDETGRTEAKKQLTERLLEIVEPTYLSLVEQIKVKNVAKFKEAAMDELKNTGQLEAINTHKFITEFRNQLRDAAIRQANWNHASEKSASLQSEIDSYTQWINAVNIRLVKEKKDRKHFWRKLLTKVANAIVPGLGTILLSAPSLIEAVLNGGNWEELKDSIVSQLIDS